MELTDERLDSLVVVELIELSEEVELELTELSDDADDVDELDGDELLGELRLDAELTDVLLTDERLDSLVVVELIELIDEGELELRLLIDDVDELLMLESELALDELSDDGLDGLDDELLDGDELLRELRLESEL